MLLVLVVILLLIWAAVVWSIYSNFLVFYSSFNESENYHKAYYNSISALERAELVTKQRAPWYIGSWGWILWENVWNISDPDQLMTNFSYLSDQNSKNKSSVYRTINSRTSRIPQEWWWDIETMLAADDSLNYNMMDYNNSQIFLLFYDNSDWNPYTKTSCPWTWCTESSTSEISWVIRLPWKISDISDGFWPLDKDKWLTSNWPKDDTIVDRQIRWKYKNGSQTYPFTIFATQNFNINNQSVDYTHENAIRESSINETLNFQFWNTRARSPIPINNNTNLTIISPQWTNISTYLNDPPLTHFTKIFNNENFTEKQLRFSLLNLLISNKNMIYPFLEYYVDFWTDVSDKYFNINAEWSYDDYHINTIVRKPTNKESILWNFTTIF